VPRKGRPVRQFVVDFFRSQPDKVFEKNDLAKAFLIEQSKGRLSGYELGTLYRELGYLSFKGAVIEKVGRTMFRYSRKLDKNQKTLDTFLEEES